MAIGERGSLTQLPAPSILSVFLIALDEIHLTRRVQIGPDNLASPIGAEAREGFVRRYGWGRDRNQEETDGADEDRQAGSEVALSRGKESDHRNK